MAREIDGERMEEERVLSPDGDLLEVRFDDGFSYEMQYDRAGRLLGVGDFWQLEAQDAAGRVLRERFGNGLVNEVSRDAIGLPAGVTLSRGSDWLYRVGMGRTAYGALSTVVDQDGRGRDHSATFGYDEAGRLTTATMGSSEPFSFSYAYDALQNMRTRTYAGPQGIMMMSGEYRYGENGAGPRQLTSVRAPGGNTLVSYGYDQAGRQVMAGGRTHVFDAADQLVRVEGLPGNRYVEHAYGHDGERVRTREADGTVERFFSPEVSERDGKRIHYVSNGAEAVARVVLSPPAGSGSSGAAAGAVVPRGPWWWVFAGSLFGFLALAGLGRAGRGRRLILAFCAVALAQVSCGSSSDRASIERPSWNVESVHYLHRGVSPGPSLVTDAQGIVLEERRYEPFGAPIDAHSESDTTVGAVDFRTEPLNSLDKRTDPDSRYSYHGARWMSPFNAAWLSPDPPVKAPDPGFMEKPWALHPYQYVEQNPTLYWDPDGESPASYIAKQAAKRGLKYAVRHYIKNVLEKKVKRIANKKVAKQLMEQADQIVGMFTDPWYMTVVELTPIAGDAVGAYRLYRAHKRAFDRLEFLEWQADTWHAAELAYEAKKKHKGVRTAAEAGISRADAKRIQNAATRTKQRITVVGSRANGTAGPTSDWDYVMSGPSKARHSARSSVPRGTAGGEINSAGRETGVDVWSSYPDSPSPTRVNPDLPHVVFDP